MNSYNGNIGLINKYTAPVLLEWLKNGTFHMMKLFMAKHGLATKVFISMIVL